jgi:hypothetical protein
MMPVELDRKFRKLISRDVCEMTYAEELNDACGKEDVVRGKEEVI